MIVLLADSKPCITRSVLSGKDQKIAVIQVTSPSFSSSLDAILKQNDLELAVIECHVNEKACLPLINIIKKRRNDVPVLFITSTDTDHAVAEAFRRGARDCFRNPFDLNIFKERVRALRSLRSGRKEHRMPLLASDGGNHDEHQLLSDLPENIVRVLDFLEDHIFSRDLSLSHLASTAGMSPFHFCRRFKKTTGVSPMQYVVRLRIERAKKLLRHHSKTMSVSQIANTVGFYDSSNLNRHFKRLTGLTPTEFIHSSGTSD